MNPLPHPLLPQQMQDPPQQPHRLLRKTSLQFPCHNKKLRHRLLFVCHTPVLYREESFSLQPEHSMQDQNAQQLLYLVEAHSKLYKFEPAAHYQT